MAPAETKTYNIFENVGANPYIQNLVSYLKEKGDTASFRRTFALEYGIPLWSKSTVLKQGNTTSMLVPLKDCDANYITGIWVFEVKNGKIRYNVARNEQCEPYYKTLEPFFRELEQSLFGIKRDGASYIRKGGTQKGCNITVTTYCVWTQAGTDESPWIQHCWSTYDMSISNDFDTGGGDSGGGDYIGGGFNPTPEPKIDDEKLRENPCAKLAWDLLKTNYSFSTIIQKFVGNYSLLNISFEMVTNLENSNGIKCDALISPLLGKDYIISIDNSFASNASTLEVARAITHEIIHAELNYFYYECGQDKTVFQQKYPDLYARWEAYGFSNRTLYQHEEINNFYRSEMKSILMDICPGYSSNVYDAVIWGGLTGTQEWANLSSDEQNAIKAIVSEQRKAGSGNCSN